MAEHASSHTHSSDEHVGHRVPLWVLAATLAALLALTVLTVSVTAWDFGRATNLWMAMIIATIKATLVALYFMHVRYDKPIVGLILIGSLAFVTLFIALTLMDAAEYQPYLSEFRESPPPGYTPPEMPGEPPPAGAAAPGSAASPGTASPPPGGGH